MAAETPFILGIDLGTTNTALAYIRASEIDARGRAPVHDFPITQLVKLGMVEERPTLPSFLYLAGQGELPPGSLTLPWDAQASRAVGTLARDHGAKVPTKLVSSAKSWLSYGGADRRSPILPAGVQEGERVSPVEALSAYLTHLRQAWNASVGAEDPAYRFEAQQLVLTVPASFDPVARELTVEAAVQAGLKRELVSLLEEPQAALYAWLTSAGEEWRDAVGPGDLILVCDIGGGTSDFSLIAVNEVDGQLALDRVAVGDHILLGGDNFDLALAHVAQQKLAQKGSKLDAWQSRELWLAARQAKETLLSRSDVESHPIAVLGRSSRLIGGTIQTEITKAEVEAIAEAFFPACNVRDRPAGVAAAGLTTVGLPYASDPAVTKHLASFLGRHASASDSGADFARPSAILYNGGVFQALSVRDRLHAIVDHWVQDAGGSPLAALEHDHLDLAVCRGAAYAGLVSRGKGIRIRGGTAHSYYVGVESAMPAIPGMAPPVQALCVAPVGMEDGAEAEVGPATFHLTVGQPARFRFFSSSSRADDASGSMLDPFVVDELRELDPLEVALEAHGDQRSVPVQLKARVSEIGTIEVWGVATDGSGQWRLEYDIRSVEQS